MPDSVALVTGGSRGIGRGVATRLARDHGTVAFTFHENGTAAEEVADEIGRAGARPFPIQVDLADLTAAARVVSRALAACGRVDSVVCNAGIAEPVNFLELDINLWQRTIDVNLSSVFVVVQHAAQSMADHGGGSIVTVGSPAGLNGGVTGAHYAASKAGLIGLTVAAARSVGASGVRVNLIEPAFVQTDMVQRIADETGLDLVPPRGRRGDVEEVAEVVAFLCSPASSYVSGARIAVSGAA